MAEEEKKFEKKDKAKIEVKDKHPKSDLREETLVRVLSTDLPGSKKIFVGLTRIKGVSWSFANAVCAILGIDKNRKISELSKPEIEKLSEFIKNPQTSESKDSDSAQKSGISDMPEFLMNRRKDRDSGKSCHVIGSELDMKKEFDIKRLKKIRSYRGWRHALGQPVRGQRTKSHFRKKGKKKAIGVTSKPKPEKK